MAKQRANRLHFRIHPPTSFDSSRRERKNMISKVMGVQSSQGYSLDYPPPRHKDALPTKFILNYSSFDSSRREKKEYVGKIMR